MAGRPAPPPAKSGASGCLIALAIVGGVLLVLGLVAGYAIYRALASPGGKKVVGFIREATRVGVEATTAPGTDELRRLGCDQALVMDVAAIAQAFAGDAGVAFTDGPAHPRLMVTCQVGAFGKKALGCADVASTYVAAVGRARGHFRVTVQQQLKPGPQCTECYDPAGVRIACAGSRGPARGAPAADPDD